jgi:DNA repair exonuclease SbcCD ATPase subunit
VQAGTLAEVADELYGLPPGDFIAARDEQARQAKAAGRRDDAAAIRKLARPTTSAWLVNQLSRGAPEELGRLFEVGAELLEAQRTLAGDRLRELSAQRRQVVSDLLPVAARLASQARQPASAAVLEEVRATLEAALADQQARDAVRSGRLTKALAYAGIGEVDLTAALAQVPQPTGRAARDRTATGRASPGRATPEAGGGRKPGGSKAAPHGRAPAASQPQSTAAKRAADALAEAEDAAASAADAVASADRDLSGLAEQRQFQRRRITHLERELAQAKDEDARLASDEREVTRRRGQAQRELSAAQRRLDQARRGQQPPDQEDNRTAQPRGRDKNRTTQPRGRGSKQPG